MEALNNATFASLKVPSNSRQLVMWAVGRSSTLAIMIKIVTKTPR